MADHPDLIAGLYDHPRRAESVLERLEGAGLRPEQLQLERGAAAGIRYGGGNAESPRSIVKDAALGTVIGGAVGVGVAGVAGVVAPVIFAGAPLLGPLLAAGYGASIGGTVGAVAGLRLEPSEFSRVLDEALSEGYSAVLVRPVNSGQVELVEQIFKETTPERPLEQ